MRIGFIVTKTPSENGFKTFLQFLNIYLGKEEIYVYLVGDGVYGARKGQQPGELREIIENDHLYALSEDLQARGISPEQIFPGTEIVASYQELVVAIMEEMDQILTF
ncbi:MAG: sulfurtransferase complex subunit TusB [Methanobacteriaceae archaeon]